jgi:hypothetical protein
MESGGNTSDVLDQLLGLAQAQHHAALNDDLEKTSSFCQTIVELASGLDKNSVRSDQRYRDLQDITNKTSLIVASRHADTAAQLHKLNTGLKLATKYKS